jgi:hypothetical protein
MTPAQQDAFVSFVVTLSMGFCIAFVTIGAAVVLERYLS